MRVIISFYKANSYKQYPKTETWWTYLKIIQFIIFLWGMVIFAFLLLFSIKCLDCRYYYPQTLKWMNPYQGLREWQPLAETAYSLGRIMQQGQQIHHDNCIISQRNPWVTDKGDNSFVAFPQKKKGPSTRHCNYFSRGCNYHSENYIYKTIKALDL